LIETIAFHGGVILASAIVLNILDWVRTWKRSSTKAQISGIRQEFRSSSLKFELSPPLPITNTSNRYTLIPLTIFYSSLTKLFLLFLLSIWRPTPPEIRSSAHSWNGTLYDNVFVSKALEILDEDKLDREWVARNVLGGMAAGFGLRGAYLNISRKLDQLIVYIKYSRFGLPPDIHDCNHPRRMDFEDCRC
jgi:lipid intermediate transporter